MPNENKRPSITKTLLQRYEEQRVGGAYDAKAIVTNGQYSPIEDSTLSALHTKPGFKTRMLDQQTELKEAQGSTSLQSSLMLKGFNNDRYDVALSLMKKK
jgi:hypothetical protein